MNKTILITGGAGFIGSHLSDELLARGYKVKAFDNLSEQVHGEEKKRPAYLNPEVELIIGDIRSRENIKKALAGVDAVFHFAAMVGVGQSMYQVKKYVNVNSLGTAALLEELIKKPVEKVVVASSMSIYGEGLYRKSNGKIIEGQLRPLQQLKKGYWELQDHDGESLAPLPVTEDKTPTLGSVYALSKYDQERLCMMTGHAYKIPTVALRFFNVYGIRQSLSNPYTGVLAIFASRYLNNQSPVIFEDGKQRRDFVAVSDVAYACRLALEKETAQGEVFNIGSGQSYTVKQVADEMAKIMRKQNLPPEITEEYRFGDIRHCFADITKAEKILDYKPRIQLQDGLKELSEWLGEQVAIDNVNKARQELAMRGLTI